MVQRACESSSARRPLALFFRYLSQNSLVVEPKRRAKRVLPAAFAGGRSSELVDCKNENNFKRWITRLVRR